MRNSCYPKMILEGVETEEQGGNFSHTVGRSREASWGWSVLVNNQKGSLCSHCCQGKPSTWDDGGKLPDGRKDWSKACYQDTLGEVLKPADFRNWSKTKKDRYFTNMERGGLFISSVHLSYSLYGFLVQLEEPSHIIGKVWERTSESAWENTEDTGLKQ